MFLPDSSEYLCPVCREGRLIFRDYCKRIKRHEGGKRELIDIPRHQCNNPKCCRIHRMIPDILVPFKHYAEEVISKAVNDVLDLCTTDDAPSLVTIQRWKRWIQLNATDIDGQLKSIAYRELDYTMELLKSSVSLLKEMMCSFPTGWLKPIIIMIYNSGASLIPVYT